MTPTLKIAAIYSPFFLLVVMPGGRAMAHCSWIKLSGILGTGLGDGSVVFNCINEHLASFPALQHKKVAGSKSGDFYAWCELPFGAEDKEQRFST